MINEKIKNKFGLSEWSGAIGDLGTLLPLAFALVVYNGFPASRILLLFGIVYLITGWIYKVPVSVQPLKVMSVIAIAHGFSINLLATTSFFYGILLIVLSMTGAISWLQKLFSKAVIRGIQLGIGLILAQKSIQLVQDKGFLLFISNDWLILNFILLAAAVFVIWYFQKNKNIPIGLILITLSIIGVMYIYGFKQNINSDNHLIAFQPPDVSLLLDGIIYLMIPQLPLTLGNAIFAASESCNSLWGKQAKRVNPSRLGLSIGISNMAIGMAGGFPVCHGAGGIAAHAQFGGRTGGATIIIGLFLMIAAMFDSITTILFMIPVPILGAMLLFDSWRMMILFRKGVNSTEIVIALAVGLISFLTRNISFALIIGISIEYGIKLYQKYKNRKMFELKGYEE